MFISWKEKGASMFALVALLSCRCTSTALFVPSASTFISHSHNTLPTRISSPDGSHRSRSNRWQQHQPLLTPLLPPRNVDVVARRSSCSFALFSSKEPIPDFLRGAPSTPGFKPGQFEALSSWATSTDANRPVVAEYNPDGFWLWTQFEGTIRQMTYKNLIVIIIWAVLVDVYAYQHYSVYILATAAMNGGDVGSLLAGSLSSVSFEIPNNKDPFIETLTALNSLWEYQLTLATFTLSFFVNHAYSNWRSVYFCTRAIQGRINDLCLLVTLGARRTARYGEVEGITGYESKIDVDHEHTVTETKGYRDAKRLVQDVTRMLRMSHTLFWAAAPIASDGLGDLHHTDGGMLGADLSLPASFDPTQYGPMLLSEDGLKMLVRCGQLTENEMNALVATGLPPSQYPYVLLEWAGLRCMDGMEQGGVLRGGPGMEDNLLKNLSQLRAEYFSIGDYAAGRMPMAYVQTMEVLVDTLIFLAPLALYTKMGYFNIFSSAFLTLFFKGLLELSKSFLDPFGSEGYRAHNIRVDVLVSEMNFGASSRWVAAGDSMPSELLERDDEPIQSTTASQPSSVTPVPSEESPFKAWMAQDYDMLSTDNPSSDDIDTQIKGNGEETDHVLASDEPSETSPKV